MLKSKKEFQTSLLKALIFEKRLPWRYKELGFIRGFFQSLKKYDLNSSEFWNMRYSVKDKWRSEIYHNLIKYIPKNKKISILDVGCGLGDGCLLLKKKNPNASIFGCDFSSIAIKKAKKRNKNIKFFVKNILKENLKKRYDIIIFVSVLEHFPNPFEILDNYLKNANKYVIIDSPFKDPIGSEHKFMFNEDSFKKYNAKYEIYDKRITYVINK